MLGVLLFARARRTASAATVLVGLGILELCLGTASVQLSDNNSLSVPWVVVVPALAGTVIGASARSALADLEQGAVRTVHFYRLVHGTTMLCVALLATAIGTVQLAGDLTAEAATRNLIGFTGLALVSSVLFGGNAAWALPVPVALLCLVAGASAGRPRAWAWPIHTNADRPALLSAILLGITGLLLITLRGTREDKGDSP